MLQTTYNPPENSYHLGYESEYPGYIHPVPPIIEKSAPEEKKLEKSAQVGKQRRKSARERLSRDAYIAAYRERKDFYKYLRDESGLAPLEAAQWYWNSGGNDFPLDAFKASASTKERLVSTALEEGKLGRLLASLESPVMYSLKHHHLGLPRALSSRECIFDKEVLKAWRQKLDEWVLPYGPYDYRFEVGKENQLHVHLITNRITEGPLASITSKKVATEIYEEVGAAKYLRKPTMPWNVETLALRIEKERIRGAKKRFPRTRGTVGIPNRKRKEL